MNHNPKLNASGCMDMTAYKAIQKVDRNKNTGTHGNPEPQKVYICSPFAGDTETNVENALKYCRFALCKGKFPIAPHCYLPRFMDDNIPAERELALSFGLQLLNGCREIWIFGSRISEGMKREILNARRKNIRIRQFNENLKEISL